VLTRTIVFLILNFGALALGSFLMGGSPAENEWYQSLNKAPWTPPGWVFGVAWTLIMIFFSIYMAVLTVLFRGKSQRQLFNLYGVHWVLNVLWNIVFFQFHLVLPALLILLLLIVILVLIHLNFARWRGALNLYIAPYLLWLIVAFSLNFYVLIAN
jgi:tryptophan-rich sensory protein